MSKWSSHEEDKTAPNTAITFDDHSRLPSDVKSSEQSQKRPPTRRAKHISRRQATNLIAALDFSNSIGLCLNVAIDIFWLMFSGSVDDRTRISRCQERLSKWFARRGFALTMIWVREIGKHGAPHVHILVHVPPWLMETGEFQSALESSLEPEGGPVHEKAIMIKPAYAPEGKLRYNLKGLSRRDAAEFHIRASFQGEIEGKRVGCTENIGPRARSRWQNRKAV
jgi:hypothetical protein